MTERILVTGATGNVGRHVVSQLREMGVAVRALVRDPGAATLPDGVEVVRGDLTDPDSVDAALPGVAAVFLLWPFLTTERAPVVIDVIARRTRRLVYLSAMAVRDDHAGDNGVWGELEELIERSGLQWTFLRPGGFATNTLGWAEQIRRDGVVRWPYGGAARSLIHERDIAAVAVRALTADRHVAATYVLTGPQAISQAEQVRIIGEVTGREVRWEELAPDIARQQLLAAWGDAGFVERALSYWANLVTEPEPVTRTVEEVTGVPARTFREWVLDHVDDFRAPTTAEVADAYVSSFRAGDLDGALRLFSTDAVRVAPMESAEGSGELRGVAAIMDNSARQGVDYEFHGVDIDGPYLTRDRFAVRFALDQTHTATGRPATTTKMSLYTVTGGQITREEVYHLEPPY